jgi:hypothetical protein
VAGILVSSLVLDPLSNSDNVSTRVGDWLFYASDVVGPVGVLLLLVALVCFILRRRSR